MNIDPERHPTTDSSRSIKERILGWIRMVAFLAGVFSNNSYLMPQPLLQPLRDSVLLEQT